MESLSDPFHRGCALLRKGSLGRKLTRRSREMRRRAWRPRGREAAPPGNAINPPPKVVVTNRGRRISAGHPTILTPFDILVLRGTIVCLAHLDPFSEH